MKSTILSKGRGRFSPLFRCLQFASYKTTTTTDLSQFGNNDIGCLYRVPDEHVNSLCFDLVLPKGFKNLTSTLREYVWMFRRQTCEVFLLFNNLFLRFKAFKYIQNFENGQTTQRLLLWGDWGTGKTITLVQLAHLALTQNFVILFKQQNQHNWKALSNIKATKKYEWSQMEQTDIGKPITEIVEIVCFNFFHLFHVFKGLSAPYLATDCVGALYKELRIHATNGELKLLVLIDKANGLFGKCVIKKPDRTIANIDELALTIHIRKFLFSNWSNGLCAFVADKAEASDARDKVTIIPIDPELLLGDLNYEQLKPFISLKTSIYSLEEINVMHEYFLEKNWLRQAEGSPGEEAKKQLIYLSAFNPAYYERMCAMSWNLQVVPPTPVEL